MTTVANIHHLSGGERMRYRSLPGTVYIGRPSKWGNPFTHLASACRPGMTLVPTRQQAVWRYEDWVKAQPELMAALPELKGKTLLCWCEPQACHGHVLARLADQA